MKNYFFFLALIAAVLASCEQEPDPRFLIAEDQVGYLLPTTRIAALEERFKNDSVVRDTLSFQLGKVREQIRIFEKGGAHLLTVTPSLDSVPTPANIRIVDPRFTTVNGLGINNTYLDFEKAFPVEKVSTALNNIVVFFKNSNLYLTIEKQQLPENVRYANQPVEAVQIPDKARIKYLMVAWD